jgi:hypothetical protein
MLQRQQGALGSGVDSLASPQRSPGKTTRVEEAGEPAAAQARPDRGELGKQSGSPQRMEDWSPSSLGAAMGLSFPEDSGLSEAGADESSAPEADGADLQCKGSLGTYAAQSAGESETPHAQQAAARGVAGRAVRCHTWRKFSAPLERMT